MSAGRAVRGMSPLITRNCHPPDGGADGNISPASGRVPVKMAQTPLQAPSSSSVQGELGASHNPPARLPDTAAVMSKSRLENFRVASPVLPRALRADLYALYGFARLVDDIGDEAQGD